MRIVVVEQAASRIVEEIRSAGMDETGGLVIGRVRSDVGITVVAAATGPGRRAIQRPTRLVLDTADLQREVDDAFAASSGDHNYIGDWHLHHAAKPSPSMRDLASLAELADDDGLAISTAVLLIVGKSRRGQLSWRAWCGADAVEAEVVLATEQ